MKRHDSFLFRLVSVPLLLIFSVLCLYPFLYIILYSLSDPQLALREGVTFWPQGFTFENYQAIFDQKVVVGAALVSTAKTIITTVLTVVCSALFAYAVTKNALPFRKGLYRVLVASMYLSIGIIPLYITYKYLGLRNNFWVYVLPNIVAPFYIVLAKTFFEQLPGEIEESAMIDGANHFQIFARVILPLSAPILATVAIFQAVYIWNVYYDNLYFVSQEGLQTLQMTLYNFLQQQQGSGTVRSVTLRGSYVHVTPTSIKMTITVIATLPILFVYPFMQRFFLKGLLLGAVKG